MDFTRLKKLVVPEGTVKKVEIGGRTVWQAKIEYPSLGSSLTSAQSTAIRAGNFNKLPVGGYWTFNNIRYSYVNESNATVSDTYSGTMRVADYDYYLNTGDTKLTTHHVVVVPDTPLYNAKMNDTSTTSGGYAGSKMRTVHLRRAEAIFKACFGASHVLTHREYLVNTVMNGEESAGAWYDSVVELMDERMVLGDNGGAKTSLPSVSSKQLSLFKNDFSLIISDNYYWLRNINGNQGFYLIYSTGNLAGFVANFSLGVRPAALIY